MNRSIVLFDGVCNLCNSFVQFLIRRDRHDRFRFGSLQSPEAKQLLNEQGSVGRMTSIVLLENGKLYEESTAVLKIFRHLGIFWKLLYGFILIPPFIRNFFYRLIARNRYRWFGRKDECMIPSPEMKKKFLSDDDQ